MKSLFQKEGLLALRRFAGSNVLLAFDFDGTLAPIVQQPEAARMLHQTVVAFRRVCELYRCVVISGRARQDVQTWLDGARVRAVIGNHGLEPAAGRADGRRVRAWAGALAPLEMQHPGVANRGQAILARGSPPPRASQACGACPPARGIRSLGPVHQVPGKQLINLLPSQKPDKGDALLHLRAKLHAETAIYVGDDATDEQVFALGDAHALLPVRVGYKARSRAWYYLHRQRDINQLLTLLVREATAVGGGHP